ncbi:hypothetical protein [Roseateles terrae]|uniref:Lipocalin-like domain-containing protein n=1 Tax=Roseateles terrae TaxID=431060 RepID=A0ABR6GNE1_9BURK|nr:hypothetical protein [Roseateles terrae]MBB3193635.1 hypothetical protein [Roseateles terrae]OWQ89203.1 hypothetical protein CDN98_01215 [Roseateles terrae]
MTSLISSRMRRATAALALLAGASLTGVASAQTLPVQWKMLGTYSSATSSSADCEGFRIDLWEYTGSRASTVAGILSADGGNCQKPGSAIANVRYRKGTKELSFVVAPPGATDGKQLYEFSGVLESNSLTGILKTHDRDAKGADGAQLEVTSAPLKLERR